MNRQKCVLRSSNIASESVLEDSDGKPRQRRPRSHDYGTEPRYTGPDHTDGYSNAGPSTPGPPVTSPATAAFVDDSSVGRNRRELSATIFAARGTSATNLAGAGTISGTPTALEAALVREETIHLSARPRRILTAVICILHFVSFVLLILVQTGSTNKRQASSWLYFFRFDLSSVFPLTVDNAHLINSVARTAGLHDYYQVGLWGYCEGYVVQGITQCSRPRGFYWFNPEEILVSELLIRSTITLPATVTTILTILRITSQIMFGTFIVGIALHFVLCLASPVILVSRWWSLPASFLASLATLLSLTGATIATVLTIAFRIGTTVLTELNIGIAIGTPMFVFVWTATGLGLAAFILHTIIGCTAPVRDGETGYGTFPREKTSAANGSVGSSPALLLP